MEHPFAVGELQLCGTELVLVSGMEASDLTSVSLASLDQGVIAVGKPSLGHRGVSTGLRLQRALFAQAVLLKTVTFAQMAAFAVVDTPTLPQLKRPGETLAKIQTLGLHMDSGSAFEVCFVCSQVVAWLIYLSFAFVQEPAQLATVLTPLAQWPQRFFKAFGAFCRYAMGPLLISLLKASLWPLANSSTTPLWWPWRFLGALSATTLVVIALRLAAVDHLLNRIEVVNYSLFACSSDVPPTEEERRRLYRHPLCPKTPVYDLGRAAIKTLLTLVLLFVVPYSQVLGAAIRVLCGAALLIMSFVQDAYFEVTGRFWNAFTAAGDAGVFITYVASLAAAMLANDEEALASPYMVALSASCLPAAALAFRLRRQGRMVCRYRRSTTSTGLTEPLLPAES